MSAKPALERMKGAGVEIVRDLKPDPRHGHESFFVRGPDGLLIEVVEDKRIPEGNWSE